MITKIIIGILIVLPTIITAYIVYRRVVSFRKVNELALEKKFKRIQPLFDKLDSGELVTQNDIYDYAKDMMTRELTFQLLQHKHLTDLFPEDFYTIEKGAESNLVNWLDFPTELGTCPDEIEHLKRVAIDLDGQKNLVYYHVYKFRMHHPHWAANDGWMLGVVGPYFDNSKPYDHPNSTFSRLNKNTDTNFPEEEAKWVHENISLQFANAAKYKDQEI